MTLWDSMGILLIWCTLGSAAIVFMTSITYTIPILFEEKSCCFRIAFYVYATWLYNAFLIHYYLIIWRTSVIPHYLKVPFPDYHDKKSLQNSGMPPFYFYLRIYKWLCHNIFAISYRFIGVAVQAKTNPLEPDKVIGDETIEWHPCLICQEVVPPRAWHCKHCKKCVLQRDHHAFFAKSCIGERNYVNYIGFWVYAWIGTISAGIGGILLAYKSEVTSLII